MNHSSTSAKCGGRAFEKALTLFEEYAFRPQIVQESAHSIVFRVGAGVKCRRGHVLSEERRERTVSNSDPRIRGWAAERESVTGFI